MKFLGFKIDTPPKCHDFNKNAVCLKNVNKTSFSETFLCSSASDLRPGLSSLSSCANLSLNARVASPTRCDFGMPKKTALRVLDKSEQTHSRSNCEGSFASPFKMWFGYNTKKVLTPKFRNMGHLCRLPSNKNCLLRFWVAHRMESFSAVTSDTRDFFGSFWGSQIVRVEQWSKKACGCFSLSYFMIMNHIRPFCGNLANSSGKNGTRKTAVAVNFHPLETPQTPVAFQKWYNVLCFPFTHFHGTMFFWLFFSRWRVACKTSEKNLRFGGEIFQANDYGHTDRWRARLVEI